MSKAEVTVRASTSEAIQFRLLAGTAPLNLSGYGTVELYLKNNAGGTSIFSTTNKLSVNDAAQGSVSFTPGTADLVNGSAPYTGYFKLYASATSWSYVPEDSELTIHVRKTF